ncbi:MAG: hypothetical protein QXQ94_10400 [Candidatus Bathyarchaeia archaeon]
MARKPPKAGFSGKKEANKMQLQRLTVGKGKTSRPSEAEEWTKEYYEIEVLIDDPAELEVTKANLTGLIDGWLSKPKTTTAEDQKSQNIDELFPKDLRQLLTFEEREGFCIIKPRQFLGSENFAKIADIVKAKGGEYISSGKNSHFRIPIKTS